MFANCLNYPKGVAQIESPVVCSSCGTPSGFVQSQPTISQGGAALPLTLGYDVQPLRGIRLTAIKRVWPNLELLKFKTRNSNDRNQAGAGNEEADAARDGGG